MSAVVFTWLEIAGIKDGESVALMALTSEIANQMDPQFLDAAS
jgi:hypothetical protein|tara:strand:+ start:366 stop:494 length:129 start_codon:yes stop_codon:yes gene_type:complete